MNSLILHLEGNRIEIPGRLLKLEPFSRVFHLGIEFKHFFKLYFLYIESIFEGDLMDYIVAFVKAVHTLNIRPVFVFTGLTDQQIDYYTSVLIEMAINTLMKLGVQCVFSPAYATAQLNFLLESNCINAVMASPYIATQDVPTWIHYIDITRKSVIVLSSNIDIVTQLIKTEIGFSHFTSPYFGIEHLKTRIDAPIYESDPTQIRKCISFLLACGLMTTPRLAKSANKLSSKCAGLSLTQNCTNHLTRLSNIYYTLLRNITNLPLSKLLHGSSPPVFEEFLPLILEQARMKQECVDPNKIFTEVLSAQNIVSRRFLTLFDCLESVTAPSYEKSDDVSIDFIITESIRRFLTAHEYIAPGEGLSPWGRAVLCANAGFDEIAILFIELIRADTMDAELNDMPVTSGVGVTDIIERIFSLFPSSTPFPPELHKSHLSGFLTVAHMVNSALFMLMQVIILTTYLTAKKTIDIDELGEIYKKIPFRNFKSYSTGALMRFILESNDENLTLFIKDVPDKQALKDDVEKAFDWWNCLCRATRELKQRSLRPNSRVSNLINFLMLFECADQFIQKRRQSLAKYF